MATTAPQTSRKGEFTIDAREHGYPDGPAHVLVEVSPAARDTYMAILAAGADGRYSFDFVTGRTGIKIEKAYVEGMREPVDELPEWMDAVRERVADEMEA